MSEVFQKTGALSPCQGVNEGIVGASPRLDIPSFAEIFRDHVPFLWRATVALGIPPADAEDVCQEVMLVVHRRLPEFDGRSLRGWLYGICLRVASDHRRSARFRRERPTEALPETELAPTQPDEVDARRAEEKLRAALETLDEDKRAVFVLFEIQELTLREIAEAVGVPLQTIYSRLKAAREHVRQAFSAAVDERRVHEAG